MTKKEISNDVFDALPIEVRESKLTINQKKILNVLFNYSTLDKSLENGSFFISNEQLLKEAELEYPTQLQRVLSFLITNKFIERIAGTRSLKNNTSSASTYTINTKELIEYCEQHPQKTTKKGNVSKGNVSKGNVSMGNGVKNVTDVTVIDELRKEIELLKVRINKLEMGNSNGNGNKITNVTTDIDTDIDNNNKFINNNINIDKTDEIFLSNFVKVDNINVDNSNSKSENLKIETRNMNKENIMNGMNNINNSNETDINNSTKSLEDILTEQSDEFNDIIQIMNNSVVDTDASDTSDKSVNISVEEQERYSRLFDKCKSQIEIWSKTHDYSCVSTFDAYFKAIQDMNDNNLITPKQWNTAKRYLFERFNNLRNGYMNYIQNKNKTISSNKISECYNPQPPRPEENENKAVLGHENAQDNKTISQSEETQQDANKRANMAIVERECNAQNKQFNYDTFELIIKYINVYCESKEEKEEWVNKYFNGITHKYPEYLELLKKQSFAKIA